MEINKKIISILKRKKMSLAIAESCTGGGLSSSITAVSGSSKVFGLGLVTYSNQSKIKILKVPQTIISRYGAVSTQCCLSMVNNLKKISKCKICLAVTGIAGPKGGSIDKPVGTVFVGVKRGSKAVISKFKFKNNGRAYIQKSSINKALKLLLTVIS